MRALDPPNAKLWQMRADWFRRAYETNAGPRPPELDARAERLLGELEVAFCAAAWAAVVILAWAMVEAGERAHPEATPQADADWLRERRNALIHADPRADTPLPDEAELEAIAQGAVRVALSAQFAGAWR